MTLTGEIRRQSLKNNYINTISRYGIIPNPFNTIKQTHRFNLYYHNNLQVYISRGTCFIVVASRYKSKQMSTFYS